MMGLISVDCGTFIRGDEETLSEEGNEEILSGEGRGLIMGDKMLPLSREDGEVSLLEENKGGYRGVMEGVVFLSGAWTDG